MNRLAALLPVLSLLALTGCGGKQAGKPRPAPGAAKERESATRDGRRLAASLSSKVIGVEPLQSSRLWKIVLTEPGQPKRCISIDIKRFKPPVYGASSGAGWADIAC